MKEMRRELVFDSGGIIEGEIMRDLIELFPETKDQFKQRKTYDEYYYTPMEVNLTTEVLDRLTTQWSVRISNGEIAIL